MLYEVHWLICWEICIHSRTWWSLLSGSFVFLHVLCPTEGWYGYDSACNREIFWLKNSLGFSQIFSPYFINCWWQCQIHVVLVRSTYFFIGKNILKKKKKSCLFPQPWYLMMLQLELLYMTMNYQVSGVYCLPLLFLETARVDLTSCKVLRGWKLTGWNTSFCHGAITAGVSAWLSWEEAAGRTVLVTAFCSGTCIFLWSAVFHGVESSLSSSPSAWELWGTGTKKACLLNPSVANSFHRLLGEHHHLFGLCHVSNVHLGDFVSRLSIKVWNVSV